MKVGEKTPVVSKLPENAWSTLAFLKKETPITEKPGKKTIYLLADNFFRFWYRFVLINMSAIDSGRIAKTYPHAVKQYLPDYMGLIYEKMCQDYLLYYSDSLPYWAEGNRPVVGTDLKKKSRYRIDIVKELLLRAKTISSVHPQIPEWENRCGWTRFDSGLCLQFLERATTITTISSRKADSQMDFFRHKSEVKFGW